MNSPHHRTDPSPNRWLPPPGWSERNWPTCSVGKLTGWMIGWPVMSSSPPLGPMWASVSVAAASGPLSGEAMRGCVYAPGTTPAQDLSLSEGVCSPTNSVWERPSVTSR